jgi:hypothetical protein
LWRWRTPKISLMIDDSTHDSEEDPEPETWAQVLGNVLMQSVNESLLMAQLEAFDLFSPMPASLPVGDDSPLDGKLHELSATLGGAPRLIVIEDGEPKPQYDTYVAAAIQEGVNAFMRARTSVCRTQIYLIGSALIRREPDLMNLPDDPNIRRILIDETENRFWEHVETTYFRLASFWDRIGQILDFAFFNIRQYERDGFSAVVDRIRTNFIPMSSSLRDSPAWERLRKFQCSEQNDGLKWLVRRRNLLIHSLHLRPAANDEPDNPIFMSAYNHLEEAIRIKLRAGTPEQELNYLHQHLQAAAALFPDAVDVAVIGARVVRGP